MISYIIVYTVFLEFLTQEMEQVLLTWYRVTYTIQKSKRFD